MELISRDRRFLSAAKLHASSVHPGGMRRGRQPTRTRKGFYGKRSTRHPLCNSSLLMPHTRSRALLPPAASVQPQQIESCRAPSGLTEQLLVLGNQVKSPRPLGLDSRCFMAFLCTFADAALRDDISKPRCRSRHCQGGAARLSPTTTALSSLYPGLSW